MKTYPDYHQLNLQQRLDAWWEPVWFLALLEDDRTVKEAAVLTNLFRWVSCPVGLPRSYLVHAATGRCRNCNDFDPGVQQACCAKPPTTFNPSRYACPNWSPT
ncbi:MAG: hypothetical protein EOM24_17885 [Chloroflexia bacterium]|nr:hypothetical protein [Chloroflexia bacterium]